MSGYTKQIIISPVGTGGTRWASGRITSGVTEDAPPVGYRVAGGYDTIITAVIIGASFLLIVGLYLYRLLSPPGSTG